MYNAFSLFIAVHRIQYKHVFRVRFYRSVSAVKEKLVLLFHISGKIGYVSSQDQMLLNRKEADTDSLVIQ